MGFEPKLTASQKSDIFRRTLRGESTKALTAEYGVSESLVRKIKYDKRLLAKAEKAVDAHQRHARLRIHIRRA